MYLLKQGTDKTLTAAILRSVILRNPLVMFVLIKQDLVIPRWQKPFRSIKIIEQTF